jgi:hypothetical protein
VLKEGSKTRGLDGKYLLKGETAGKIEEEHTTAGSSER